jgi:tetratricopeptide (TPR) repeat protein
MNHNRDGAPAATSRSRFVGRERELAQLRAGLDDAIAGRGRLFLISGEPGIGKTRLAEEIANDAAARGLRVVWGRCWQEDGAPAYWPWLQILRACLDSIDPEQRRSTLESEVAPHIGQDIAQIIPELRPTPEPRGSASEPKLDPEQARFRMFDSVATFLKQFARSRAMLFVLDDLHDADRSSLMMLRFVARQLAETAILIVGTHREAEVRRSPALSKLIGDLSHDARSIALAAFSEVETAELVERSGIRTPDGQLVSRLHAATDGNPLFVDGIVRILLAEPSAEYEASPHHHFKIPDSVREAIGQRLTALSDEANSLLKAAAAIGNEFEASLCEQVVGGSGDALHQLLDEASSGGITKSLEQRRYRFAHPLVRSAIYDGLGSAERAGLHRQIAVALEGLYRENVEDHLAELAHHFRQAASLGLADRAIDYSNRAGEAALAVLAFEEAVRHWEAALSLMESRAVEPERRGRLTMRLSDAWWPIDLAQMIHCVEKAIKLFELAGQPEAAAAARTYLALQYAKPDDETITDIPLATEHLRRIEQVVTQMPETSQPVLDYFMAKTLSSATSLHPEEGITAAQRGMELSERLGDREQSMSGARPYTALHFETSSMGHWPNSAGLLARHLLFCGRIKAALALLDRAREKADQLGLPLARLRAAENRSYVLLRLWDPSTAQIWLREFPGLRVAESPFHSRLLAQQLCAALLIAGELGEAAALIAQARKPLLEGTLAFRLGDWDRAEIVWTEGFSRCKKAGARDPASDYLANLADLHLARGQHASAESLLLQLLAAALDAPQVQLELLSRASLGRLYAEMNRLDEGRAHLARCHEILSDGEDWRGLRGHLERADALLVACGGNLEVASKHFNDAVTIFRRYTLPWEEAETLHLWGRALVRVGEAAHASGKLSGAIEIFRRHGAGQFWIDRTAAERALIERQGAAVPLFDQRPPDDEFLFRREGEFWTLSYQNGVFRLRDAKGLAYIAHLLRHPAKEFHVIELVNVVGGGEQETAADSRDQMWDSRMTPGLGDAGALLDPAAKVAYKRRLDELRAELGEAREFNDPGRAERAEEEIEFLTRELARAVGLSGRDRKAASHAERSRVKVTKAIRVALSHIAKACPELGRHLEATIRTGEFCVYTPDPRAPVPWRF